MKLLEYRERIDHIDKDLLRMIAGRLSVCREVAIHKFETGTSVMQASRVQEVKRRSTEFGNTLGLRPLFVEQLYDLLIREACRIEYEVIESRQMNGGL